MAKRVAGLAFHSTLVAALLSRICSATVAQSAGVPLDFTPLGAPAASMTTGLAPIDTSFGPYPMSVFGIENAIRRYDGTARLHDGPLAYAVLATRAWEARYPHDPEIAHVLLHLQRAYEHAHLAEADDYARRVALWLQTDYAESEAANVSRTELRER